MSPGASPHPNAFVPDYSCSAFFIKVFTSLGNYLLSGITFLLIIGSLVYFVHFSLLLIQVVCRKLDESLRSYAFYSGFFQTNEKKQNSKFFKKLPPPVKYCTDEEKGNKCILCAICIEEFKDGELCQVLPLCDHKFHLACIRPWLVDNQICPICRSPVINGNTKQRELTLPRH